MQEFSESRAHVTLTTDVAKQRATELFKIAQAILPEEVIDAFVSETRDQEGRQLVGSIWFFTQSLASEFKNAMQEYNFDVAPRMYSYIDVTVVDFDLHKGESAQISDSSRLTVEVRFAPITSLSGSFRASRENCRELLRITKTQILPRLVEKAAFAEDGSL